MLDIRFVQENPDIVVKKTESRGLRIDLDDFLRLIQEKKKFLKKVEKLRFERNKASKLIGQMKKEGKDASSRIREMKKVGDEVKGLEEKRREMDEKLSKILLDIPNIPHESVPEGQTPDDNVEMRRFGEKPMFSFPLKPHWDVGKKLGILDFERAAKIAGSGLLFILELVPS